MAEFLIRIPDIEKGRTEHTFPVRAAWLLGQVENTDLSADASREDGALEVSTHFSGTDILVRGQVRAHLIAECARCLGEVLLEIEVPITALLTHRDPDAPPVEDQEITPEDIEKEYYSGDEVVLDELVRETLILEVPMQPHCDDPACKARWEGDRYRGEGAAPEEEAEPEIDPRLAPLQAFLGKLKS